MKLQQIIIALCLWACAATAADAQIMVVRGHKAEPNGAPLYLGKPPNVVSFDVQLNDPKKAKDVPLVNIVELDIDIAPAILNAVKARGTKTLCYFSAGSWEDYRDDRNSFPASVLGNNYDGYPHERWIDVRNISALAPVMRARMDKCRNKGFDGIDPDNVDGYANNTGFSISQSQQLAYNRWLMTEAHNRNLTIALKNAPDLADALNSSGYDLAVTESCFKDRFCSAYQPFLDSRKPVLDMEYMDEHMTTEKFCLQANRMGISAILKRKSAQIDKYRKACI
jgi:hypothetical protein